MRIWTLTSALGNPILIGGLRKSGAITLRHSGGGGVGQISPREWRLTW